MVYVFALLMGFTSIFSMVQNSALSKKIGLVNSSLLNYVTGLITATIFFVLTGKLSDFSGLSTMHFFGYLGGAIGLFIVFSSGFIVKNVSVIITSMLMYTGQMITSFVIDYFRGINFSPVKILGIILVIIGIYVNNYIDFRSKNKDAKAS